MSWLAKTLISALIQLWINRAGHQTEEKPVTQETSTKPWWQSKTIIGASATILAAIAGIAGLEIGSGELTEILTAAATIAGGTLAIVGRVTAKKSIK
jgi:uncharacterized protein YcfJ